VLGIVQITNISPSGDVHIGNLIAQVTEKVGEKGVKEERISDDEIEVTSGMRFDHDDFSPYFVTNAKAQWPEFKKPFILLSERNISLVQDILPSLEIVAQTCRLFLIVAGGLTSGLLQPVSMS